MVTSFRTKHGSKIHKKIDDQTAKLTCLRILLTPFTNLGFINFFTLKTLLVNLLYWWMMPENLWPQSKISKAWIFLASSSLCIEIGFMRTFHLIWRHPHQVFVVLCEHSFKFEVIVIKFLWFYLTWPLPPIYLKSTW